jgi:hypothetical protein
MADETIRVYAFSSPGPQNTEATLRAAIERAKALGLKYLVVASVSGETGLKAKALCDESGYQGQLVVVSHHTGWAEPGKSQMEEAMRARLIEAGCRVVTGTHALSSIARSYRARFGGIDLLETVAEAFRRFSQGVKAAIESAIMAADSGAIPVDEDVIVVAGTGKGADSAIVMRPANQNRFFDMKVREILAMPR